MKLYFKYFVLATVIIGATNWGLIGLFNFNIFNYLFGADSLLCRIIYSLIGLSAIIYSSFAIVECNCKNKEIDQ